MLEGFQFATPWFLLALPLPVLVLWLRLRVPRATLPLPSTTLTKGLPKTLRQRLVGGALVLQTVAGLALVIALARPVIQDEGEDPRNAADILLVVDISSSMQQRDVEQRRTRRLDQAVEKAREFVGMREGDRIGLLVFAIFSELLCPPTQDHEVLDQFLVSTDIVPLTAMDGTAIGVALADATQALAEPGGVRFIILLTDGQEQAHIVEPLDAAKYAADAGIRVYTIGFGGRRGQTFPELEEIAKVSGGLHFTARAGSDLAAAYAAIDQEETIERKVIVLRTTELFLWPLGAGLGLLLLALALDVLWIRGAP